MKDNTLTYDQASLVRDLVKSWAGYVAHATALNEMRLSKMDEATINDHLSSIAHYGEALYRAQHALNVYMVFDVRASLAAFGVKVDENCRLIGG